VHAASGKRQAARGAQRSMHNAQRASSFSELMAEN